MSELRTTPLLGVALVLVLGCGGLFEPPPPSTGACTGTIGGASVDGPIDPAGSYIARDDRQNGVEHAFVGLAVRGEGRHVLAIRGHFADMPHQEVVGEHPLVDGAGYVDVWRITAPADATLEAGAITLDVAERSHVQGSLWMTFEGDERVSCTFTLGRDMNRDTDD